MCVPGLSYSDMHERAVEIISHGLVDLGLLPGTGEEATEKGWYREFFFHGTGHWLGIDVHDAGAYKVDRAGRPLEASMAFTVEPGIYVPGKWGMRLEDIVVASTDGPLILNTSDRSLVSVA